MPTKPAPDEVEVTLLGKGYGECVVLHPCDDEWLIIDSFLSGGQPAALEYLKSIGVGPDRIRLVMATHWHEDHIRGLADLYGQAKNADLVFSIALQSDEFAAFIDAHDNGDRDAFRSGAGELFDLIEINDTDNRQPALLVGAGTVLFERHKAGGATADVHVRALSPSADDIVNFVRSLAEPSSGHASRLNGSHRNGASVAAWMTVDSDPVLLGADLETEADPLRGWEAVVASPRRPFGRATAFKIPHHGSVTGHHADTWAQMVAADPVSILAPWNRGSKLPKDADITRIKGHSPTLYTAKDRTQQKYRPDVAVIDKMIAAGGGSVTSVPKDAGRVTLRKTIGSGLPWSCVLANGAAQL